VRASCSTASRGRRRRRPPWTSCWPTSASPWRRSGRRTCRGCGKIWHVEFDPPSHTDVCDRCGADLFQRDDDKPETISKRLIEYAEKTAPLVDYYGAQGKLVGIDATGPVEDVTVRAIDALRSYGG
jgi:adenylate kinase